MIKCQSFTWGVCSVCLTRIKVNVGEDLESVKCVCNGRIPSKPYEKMELEELQAELHSAGIPFSKQAKRETLIKKLMNKG